MSTTTAVSPARACQRDVDTHPSVASVVYRAHKGSQPFPGQVWRHKATGVEAEFQHWRKQPAFLGGRWVMVLFHPRFGECRWSPSDAEPVAR